MYLGITMLSHCLYFHWFYFLILASFSWYIYVSRHFHVRIDGLYHLCPTFNALFPFSYYAQGAHQDCYLFKLV